MSAAFGCVLAGTLAWTLGHDVVSCDTELRILPEPAGWMDQPTLAALGGFVLEGQPGACMEHGVHCATEDARLSTRGVCPRTGVPLAQWFVPGGIYASEADLRVRRVDTGFVVSGQRAPGAGEEFLGAFEPVARPARLAFTTRTSIFRTAALTFGLLAVLWAFVHARLQSMLAQAFFDGARWKPGMRIASGAIVFTDGSAPVPSGGGGSPGPVLVQIASVAAAGYREAAVTRAACVLDGEAVALSRAVVLRARSRLTKVVVIEALLLGILLVLEVEQALRNFSLP